MVTKKKPCCKALAPTVDDIRSAYAEAKAEMESVVPPGAYTKTELKAILKEGDDCIGFGVHKFVDLLMRKGKMKKLRLQKYDACGKLRYKNYYLFIRVDNPTSTA